MTAYAWTLTCALGASIVIGATPAYAQGVAPAAPAVVPDSTPAAAILHGRALAESQGMGGRFTGGLVSGVLLGLIGTGIVYVIAGSDNTSVPALEAAQLSTANPTYSLAFQQGYSERLKSRRKSSALTGGLLGTLVFVVVYVSATSDQ